MSSFDLDIRENKSTIQRFVDRITAASRIELCIPKLRTSTKLVEVSLHCRRRLWRSYSPREAVTRGGEQREASSSDHAILTSENDRSDEVYPFLKLQFQSRATISSELQPRAVWDYDFMVHQGASAVFGRP